MRKLEITPLETTSLSSDPMSLSVGLFYGGLPTLIRGLQDTPASGSQPPTPAIALQLALSKSKRC